MDKKKNDPTVDARYAILTEFRDEFRNPEVKRIDGFENYEKNRRGRMAYKPEKDTKAAEGILPLYSGKRYDAVIPKYTLPKVYN